MKVVACFWRDIFGKGKCDRWGGTKSGRGVGRDYLLAHKAPCIPSRVVYQGPKCLSSPCHPPTAASGASGVGAGTMRRSPAVKSRSALQKGIPCGAVRRRKADKRATLQKMRVPTRDSNSIGYKYTSSYDCGMNATLLSAKNAKGMNQTLRWTDAHPPWQPKRRPILLRKAWVTTLCRPGYCRGGETSSNTASASRPWLPSGLPGGGAPARTLVCVRRHGARAL